MTLGGHEKPISNGVAKSERALQTGHVHIPIECDGPTRIFIFALVPNFSMHSFSAAVEPLRIANQLTNKPLYQWETRSLNGQPVMASNGLSVSSDGKFSDIPKGSSIFACSGDDAERSTPKELSSFLRFAWRRGHTVGGLCTGAQALFQAGLLNGHRFTLHWECQPAFAEKHPELDLTATAFVVDRRILTSGGGVGSTDLILYLIEMEFGRALRSAVADMCLQVHVRSPRDEQRSMTAKAYGMQNPKLTKAIEYLHANLNNDLNAKEWAKHLQVSRRQLERMFTSHTGSSPMKFVTNLRFERAYSLLVGTNMTLTEITDATGLSAVSFRASFKKRFGVLPQNLTRQS